MLFVLFNYFRDNYLFFDEVDPVYGSINGRQTSKKEFHLFSSLDRGHVRERQLLFLVPFSFPSGKQPAFKN